MPINRGSHISAVIQEVKHLNPGSILDVGVGYGMMGVIFRAYTDIRMSELKSDRYHRYGFQTKIDGIEVFEQYRNPIWDDAYNFVYIGDAFLQIDHLGSYDLIYAGDIIEHLTKEQGHEFIKKALRKCNNLIIATPSPAPTQGTLLGNKYEEHLSSWDETDFADYAHEVVGSFDGILVVRIWKQ